MIRYLRHDQIDMQKWDALIQTAPNGLIYGYSWYLNIVCKGWEALVENDYTSVMPLTRGRKYLMDYIYPPFFTQQLGIFSNYPVTELLCSSFLSAIPVNYRYLEINLNISNRWVPESYSVKPQSTYLLGLGMNYEKIHASYSENHQRNIKKAEKNNLSIFKFGNVQDVIEMFRINRGRFLINLQNEHYLMFAELTAAAAARNMSKVWIVSNKLGIPVAGAVFFESHETGIFIFSAVSKEGKSLSAMHYLIDRYIHEQSLNLKLFDFEGSNDPDLARFYRGFGSAEFVYLQIKKNQLPLPWKWFKN